MAYDPLPLCGVCLEERIDVAYYLCNIAPVCNDCLCRVLQNHTHGCPLCPPNKNCEFRVDYDTLNT
jgi:hypothetical protein